MLIGVDGGGTCTRARLADAAGAVLGEGVAGPGNPRAVGLEAAVAALGTAVEGAFAAAGRTREPVAAAFLGVAGVGTPSERERVAAAVRAIGLADVVEVASDLRVAHAGALGGAPGVVVVAGTGSAAYGRDTKGREHQAGGLGSWLDDGGSAHDLGRRALAACLRASDGRGEPTALGPALAELLELDDWRALAVHEPLPRDEVAALAPAVCRAAEAGDAVAREVLDAGARELASAARAVARALELAAPLVAATGGAAAAPAYRARVVRALGSALAGARVVEPEGEPVAGAVALARGLARG